MVLHAPVTNTYHLIHSMSLESTRLRNFGNVIFIVRMANQSAHMETPVVNLNQVVMGAVLWRMLSAAVIESIAVLMGTLVE